MPILSSLWCNSQFYSALRLKYKGKSEVFLEKDILRKEPFGLFQKWLQEACGNQDIIEPNAVCLATATK